MQLSTTESEPQRGPHDSAVDKSGTCDKCMSVNIPGFFFVFMPEKKKLCYYFIVLSLFFGGGMTAGAVKKSPVIVVKKKTAVHSLSCHGKHSRSRCTGQGKYSLVRQ